MPPDAASAYDARHSGWRVAGIAATDRRVCATTTEPNDFAEFFEIDPPFELESGR